MNNSKRKLLLVAGGIAVASMAMSAALSPASAQKIRFMKVVPHPFPFLIPEIGVQEGIFKKLSNVSAYGTNQRDYLREDFWLIVVTEGNEDEAEIHE